MVAFITITHKFTKLNDISIMTKRGSLMNNLSKLLLIAVLAVLAACKNPDDLKGAGGGANGTNLGGAGISSQGLGDINDPNSIAYFNSTIEDTVFFDVDSYELNSSAKITLDSQVEWLRLRPQYTILIEGNTDERGTQEYNLALGARRADAVRLYMISLGVEPSRITTVSYGKERPIALCSDESCFSQNRRSVSVLGSGFASNVF